MRARLFFFAALLVGALAAGSWPAAGASAASTYVVMVRAGVHPDFERLVFDWPWSVAYRVQRDGNRVSIHFAKSAHVNFRDALTAHLSRMRDFSADADAKGNLVVSFTLDRHAAIKDFLSGHALVLDVRGAAAPETAHAPVVTPNTPAAPPSITLPAAAKETLKEAAPPAVQQTSPEKPAPLAPATQSPPQVTAPAASSLGASMPPAAEKLSPVIDPGPISPLPADLAPPPAAAPSPAKVETEASTASAALPAPAGSSASSKPLSEMDFGSASQLVVSLDPHAGTRAVIYQRGGYAYIIFDHKFTIDLATLIAGQPAPLADLEPLDLPKASGYRFAVPLDVEVRATREGTAWHIFLSKQHIEIPVSTAFVAQPDFALGARFLLPLAEAPEPVTFNDPIVGDTLILVPLGATEAFSVGRRMADFDVLPAAQGLVIEPVNDKLVVRNVSDGIEITAEGGLHLSRASDTGAARETSQQIKAAAAGKSIFDFTAWRGKPNETFTETRERLQQTIVDVPEAERNRARLELARFYFANGDGEEATALLHYISLLVPDLPTHADFLALLGASKILAYQPADSITDFDNPDLKGQPEIELWEAVAAAELRNWTAAEEKFGVSQAVLTSYPEPFYSRFAVLSVESALAVGKDHEAKDWLDRLENGHHRTEIDPAIEYLHGVIHSREGRGQAAEELWREVAESNDRLYRVRAELALADLDVATGALTPAKAADRLEAMRFGWRGDDLELDILYRLGQFYVQAKNIKAGLNAMNEAVRLYPKSPMTPKIRTTMADIFRQVFLGTLAPDLSAVDALTLYQEYRDLMPTGSDGDAVMRNLAERLVAIDLLDQAAGLLDELVKNRLQSVEKGRVGARLAAIRLLDHKPQLAMTALDESNDNSYPADLLAQRQLLRAKAFSELNKSDDALELLKNDDSKDARMLRADILMHAQRWADASKTLLDLIGPPPKAGETLTVQQADWLVTCAIALSLANDQPGLGKLAVDFTAPMATMPQNDTFRVLTQPEKATQLKDISAVQAKISDVDLFRGFLNAYRSAPNDGNPGAPAVIPAAAPAQTAPKTNDTGKP